VGFLFQESFSLSRWMTFRASRAAWLSAPEGPQGFLRPEALGIVYTHT
jgi:hypothetical protein